MTTGASGSPRGLAAHIVTVTGEIDISTAPGLRSSLQLICNQERLLNLFRITGLVKVFVIHGSTDAALAGN